MVEGIRKIQTPDKTVTDIPAIERLLDENLGVLSKILGKIINSKYYKQKHRTTTENKKIGAVFRCFHGQKINLIFFQKYCNIHTKKLHSIKVKKWGSILFSLK